MSSVRRSALFVCFVVVGASVTVVMLRLPDPYPWVVVAAIAALVAAFTVPLPHLVFGWAAMLPIWSIGPLPPAVFDVARLALGVVIASRAWAASPTPNRQIKSWALPLGVVAAVLIPLSWWRGEGVTGSVFLLASVVLVWLALWRLPSMWPVFLGFATGASLSAIVLVISATGIGAVGFLVPNVNPGFERYTGLGTSAPRVSTEFAVAAVVWWAALGGRVCRRLVGLAGLGVTMLALLLCGGRTGLAGLCVAVVVLTVRRWIRPAAALGLVVAGGIGYLAMGKTVQFNTLDRLSPTAPYQGGFTTGRSDLLREAWAAYIESPILGPGVAGFADRFHVGSHFPPLAFGLTGGIVAAVVVTVLTVRLIGLPFRGQPADPLSRAGCLVAAVLVGPALLEPDGPWLGVEMLALLFAAVVAVRSHLETNELLGDPAGAAGAGLLDVKR